MTQQPRSKTSSYRLMVAVIGVLAGLYLLNPTLGLFEFIPDNIPLVGNLDESTATLLLISALAFFGVKIPFFFQDQKNQPSKKKIDADEVEKGEVIRE